MGCASSKFSREQTEEGPVCSYLNKEEEIKELHEHQILGPGEVGVESEIAWRRCAKNPGHSSFIPIKNFSGWHLPSELRRNDVIEFIKLTAALTVRLRVNEASRLRPYFSYFSRNHGKCVGTGFIDSARPPNRSRRLVDLHMGEYISPTAWTFSVQTSKHVVFDDIEAKSTSADLFFDDKASQENDEVKTLCGRRLVESSEQLDHCEFECMSEDQDLSVQIARMVEHWHKLNTKIVEAGIRSGAVVIVAHPHGQAKHVTVGCEKLCRDVTDFGWLYSYTAATCPGSSGAPVLGVGTKWSGLIGWASWRVVHCKRGVRRGENEGYWGTYGGSLKSGLQLTQIY